MSLVLSLLILIPKQSLDPCAISKAGVAAWGFFRLVAEGAQVAYGKIAGRYCFGTGYRPIL